jgi:hypothetical protein
MSSAKSKTHAQQCLFVLPTNFHPGLKFKYMLQLAEKNQRGKQNMAN